MILQASSPKPNNPNTPHGGGSMQWSLGPGRSLRHGERLGNLLQRGVRVSGMVFFLALKECSRLSVKGPKRTTLGSLYYVKV